MTDKRVLIEMSEDDYNDICKAIYTQIGFLSAHFNDRNDPEVRDAYDRLDRLEQNRYEIVETVDVPEGDDCLNIDKQCSCLTWDIKERPECCIFTDVTLNETPATVRKTPSCTGERVVMLRRVKE